MFLAVVEGGTLRKAAQLMALNASTLSRRLKSFEESLGSRLFERHPEGLQLTQTGDEVLVVARRLEEGIDELRRELGGRDQKIAGKVRITAAEVIAPLLSELLVALLGKYPELEIELSISDTMATLDRHEAEIAVRVAESPPEHFIGSKVGSCRVGLYASESYLKSKPQDLDSVEHRWVAWPRGVEHKPAFRWLDEHYPKRRDIFRANSASGVCQAVVSGVGIAPLGLTQAQADLRLRCLELLPLDCATAIWVLTHRDVRQSARVRAVLSYLSDALREAVAF